jgi:4'-phosphopantetheinyl transferase
MSPGNTVDVYCIAHDAPVGALARCATLLDPAERARAARFRFAEHRRRYVVRHGRLRELLGHYLGCAPEAVWLHANGLAKPAVLGSGLRFNLSHAEGFALFAVAWEREVGCDLARRDDKVAAERVAEAFFAPGEVRALRALDPARQTEGFFNCWTRKEAYVKARGGGLSIPLNGFEVSLAPGEPAALLAGCTGWSVRAFEPEPGFQAAVVAQGADWELAFPAWPGAAVASERARA